MAARILGSDMGRTVRRRTLWTAEGDTTTRMEVVDNAANLVDLVGVLHNNSCRDSFDAFLVYPVHMNCTGDMIQASIQVVVVQSK